MCVHEGYGSAQNFVSGQWKIYCVCGSVENKAQNRVNKFMNNDHDTTIRYPIEYLNLSARDRFFCLFYIFVSAVPIPRCQPT